MSLIDKLEKIHEELIQEEGIKVADLPNDIKRKIKGWNLLYARLKKNPDDSKLYRSLQKQSVELGDKIQDFIENDFEEDEGEDKVENKSDNDKVEAKSDNNKVQNEDTSTPKTNTSEGKTQNKEPKSEPKKKNFGNLMMEKKILTTLKNNNGKISISELKAIISKEPTYPEQVVNNIKLRKIFLSSSYRKV